MPIVQHVMEIAPMPANLSPEAYQKQLGIGLIFTKVLVYCAPVGAGVLFGFQALVLLVMSSIMSVRAKFRELFNLAAGCAMIQLLSSIAGVIILKAKGEVSTMAELRPALGLDIFLPEGTNKFLVGILGYFSVFEIWWIVMLVLIYAAAFRTSKGKGFAAVLPLILLNLLFRIVGAAFQR
jgi:hypothetical protein